MNREDRGDAAPEMHADVNAGAVHTGQTVRIHIDREAYEAETPITAAALYALAGIPHGYELFREATGDAEDEFIARDGPPVRLIEDEHFYSQKDYRIIVNAREEFVQFRSLSYDQVVRLAFNPVPTGPDVIFTVTYRKGPHRHPK